MTDRRTSPANASAHPNRGRCPVNGLEYAEVFARTIQHHIEAPWAWVPTATRYYYCSAPDCEVAYFGDDGSVIPKSRLRTNGGTEHGLLCYCFGLSRAEFARNPATKDFVAAQTKNGTCSCETCNPSGHCCLKDFP